MALGHHAYPPRCLGFVGLFFPVFVIALHSNVALIRRDKEASGWLWGRHTPRTKVSWTYGPFPYVLPSVNMDDAHEFHGCPTLSLPCSMTISNTQPLYVANP
jgi:hypothetical protein